MVARRDPRRVAQKRNAGDSSRTKNRDDFIHG